MNQLAHRISSLTRGESRPWLPSELEGAVMLFTILQQFSQQRQVHIRTGAAAVTIEQLYR